MAAQKVLLSWFFPHTQTAIDTELIELTESLGSGVATTHVRDAWHRLERRELAPLSPTNGASLRDDPL